MRVVIAEDTVLLREGLARPAGGRRPRGRRARRGRRGAARRSSRSTSRISRSSTSACRPTTTTRATQAAATHPAHPPGDRGARALAAHRDPPRRRARRRGRRLRLPAEGPGARRRRLPRRRAPRQRGRLGARPAGRDAGCCPHRGRPTRSPSCPRASARCCRSWPRAGRTRGSPSGLWLTEKTVETHVRVDPHEARPAGRRRRPPARHGRARVPARSELAPSPTALRTGAGPEDRGPREI